MARWLIGQREKKEGENSNRCPRQWFLIWVLHCKFYGVVCYFYDSIKTLNGKHFRQKFDRMNWRIKEHLRSYKNNWNIKPWIWFFFVQIFDGCQTATAQTWSERGWTAFQRIVKGRTVGSGLLVWAIIFNDSRAKFLPRPAMFGRHQSRGAKCTNHQQSSGSVCWSWCPDLKGSCRGKTNLTRGRCTKR